MMGQVKHIVSNVKWDLSFNEKKEVNALQNKLSNWSKTEMLVAFEEVLGEVCPQDETWQIQYLEIDLGHLVYEDLTQDLPQKFRAALLAKLNEVIRKGYSDGSTLKIAENKNSRLKWLKTYLEFGYMPWNQVGSISVNNLLLEQLTENREALMDIIRQLGVLKSVRKRMAWQFTDPVVRKIIKELEPNTYQEIFDFTTHLSVIQEKENIVQSTASNFKKNLWFWVLNYLFEERGTLFNRLQFMESNIRQMARHYNMSFAQLFAEIEHAVTVISQKTTIKGEFIQTLKLLAKTIKTKPQKQQTDLGDYGVYLTELTQLLTDKTTRRTASNKAKTNELIEQLFHRDKEGLRRVILQVGSNLETWKVILKNISENAQRSIFSAIQPNGAKWQREFTEMVKQMGILNSASARLNWQAASLCYFVAQANQPVNQQAFIKSLLSNPHVNAKAFKKISGQRLLAQLNASHFIRHNIHVQTFENLKFALLNRADEFAIKEQANGAQNAVKTWFNLVVNQQKQNQTDTVKNAQLMEYQHVIEQFCLTHPKDVLEAIKKQQEAPHFQAAIKLGLDRKQIHFLLKHENSEKGLLLQSLIKTIRRTENFASTISGYAYENWVEESFFKLLSEPDLHVANYAAFLFKTRGVVTASLPQTVAEELTNNILKSAELKAFNELNWVELTPLILKQHNVQQNSAHHAVALTATVNLKAIQYLFLKEFKQDPEKWIKTATPLEKTKIWQAFVPNGFKVYQNLMAKAHKSYGFKKENDKKQYELVFWKCLAEYQFYKGDLNVFERFLQETLQKNLVNIKQQIAEKTGAKMASGTHSATNALVTQLNNFVDLKTVASPELVINLSAIFDHLLIEQPHLVKKIMQKAELTDIQINSLAKQVDFKLFVARVFAGSTTVYAEIRAVFALILELGKIGSGSAFTENLMQQLWQDAIQLNRDPHKSEGVFLNRIRQLFKTLALTADISAKAIFQILKQGNSPLPVYLKSYFLNMNKGFSPIFETKREPKMEEKRGALKQKIEFYSPNQVFQTVLKDNGLIDFSEENLYWSAPEVWAVLAEDYPFDLFDLIKSNALSDALLFKLNAQISFGSLIEAIRQTNPNQTVLLDAIAKIYAILGQMAFAGLSATDLQNLVFKKLVLAWKNNNWRMIAAQQIWNELIWESHLKYGTDQKRFLADLVGVKHLFPTAYQFSLNALQENEKAKTKTANPTLIQLNEQFKLGALAKEEQRGGLLTETIAVNNAGIVLINSYVNLLFERLGLMENNRFKTEEDQHAALHFLQFIVNGFNRT